MKEKTRERLRRLQWDPLREDRAGGNYVRKPEDNRITRNWKRIIVK